MPYDLKKLKHFTHLQSFLPTIFVFGFIFLSILSHQVVAYQKMIVFFAMVGSAVFIAQMLYFYIKRQRTYYLILAMYFFFLFFALFLLKNFQNWHIIG